MTRGYLTYTITCLTPCPSGKCTPNTFPRLTRAIFSPNGGDSSQIMLIGNMVEKRRDWPVAQGRKEEGEGGRNPERGKGTEEGKTAEETSKGKDMYSATGRTKSVTQLAPAFEAKNKPTKVAKGQGPEKLKADPSFGGCVSLR